MADKVSPEEHRLMIRLHRKGFGAHKIADLIGRGHSTVMRLVQIPVEEVEERFSLPQRVEEAGQVKPYDPSSVVWCPVCRVNVHPPCIVCQLRKYRGRQPSSYGPN